MNFYLSCSLLSSYITALSYIFGAIIILVQFFYESMAYHG